MAEYRCSQGITLYVNFTRWTYLKTNLQSYVRARHDFVSYAYAFQALFPPHDGLHHFKEDGPREHSLWRGILVFHSEVKTDVTQWE